MMFHINIRSHLAVQSDSLNAARTCKPIVLLIRLPTEKGQEGEERKKKKRQQRRVKNTAQMSESKREKLSELEREVECLV